MQVDVDQRWAPAVFLVHILKSDHGFYRNLIVPIAVNAVDLPTYYGSANDITVVRGETITAKVKILFIFGP